MNNGIIRHGINMLPDVFSSTFDDIEKRFFNDDFFGFQKNAKYPMNVVKVTDDEGNAVSYRLEYALAGFDESDLSIELDGDILHVSASKNSEETTNEQCVMNGISYRKMEMSYRLMDGIDKDEIAYDFKNGLLSICLPVKTVQKTGVRKIRRIGEIDA